ncbi:hypothetical protein [Sphingobium sp. TKS]|uniref:hypothetical protein n=1 Tax=Sphingobium sp. TKS TaxID=1315974 RepID=UPI0013144125|nr:hypothetical protein [Sphingobium sp. TKS]
MHLSNASTGNEFGIAPVTANAAFPSSPNIQTKTAIIAPATTPNASIRLAIIGELKS